MQTASFAGLACKNYLNRERGSYKFKLRLHQPGSPEVTCGLDNIRYKLLFFYRKRSICQTIRLSESEKRDCHYTLLLLPGFQTFVLYFYNTLDVSSQKNRVDLVEVISRRR